MRQELGILSTSSTGMGGLTMPLYKRAGSDKYWCRGSVSGHRYRCSTGTEDRTDAEEFENRERDRLWRLSKLGERGQSLWKEAADRWRTDAVGKRSMDKDETILAWLAEYLDNEPVGIITTQALNVLRTQLIKEGKAPATVDRYMALVRAILRKCRDEWGMLDLAPKVPMYGKKGKSPKHRYLSEEEFERLVHELPPHLKLAARLAVLTGLRMRAMLQLTWDRIDLERKVARIPAEHQKNGELLGIPLSSAAVHILEGLRQLNPHGTHVFQWKGKPVDDCNGKAFKDAAARAGIPELRWHDLRHTFASWALQRGVTLAELQQLGGWKSYTMVLVYAHLAPTHLLAAAEKVGGTNGAQAAKAPTVTA